MMPPRTPAQHKPRQAATLDEHLTVIDQHEAVLSGIDTRLNDFINSASVRFENESRMIQQIMETLKDISHRLQKIEVDNIGTVVTLQNQVAAAFRLIEESKADLVEKTEAINQKAATTAQKIETLQGQVPEKLHTRLEKIENVLPSIILQNKIMLFIASAIGLALISLLWAVFTGQATVIFK